MATTLTQAIKANQQPNETMTQCLHRLRDADETMTHEAHDEAQAIDNPVVVPPTGGSTKTPPVTKPKATAPKATTPKPKAP